jgi:hypothetical protein
MDPMTNTIGAEPDEPADVELLAAWIEQKRIQNHVAELVQELLAEQAREQQANDSPPLRLVAGTGGSPTPRRGKLRLAPPIR